MRINSHLRPAGIVAGLIFSTLATSSCTEHEVPVHKDEFVALGTLVQVSIYGVSEEKAQQAFAAAIDQFRTLDAAWHPTKPGPLARVNQALARQESITIDPSIKPLIELGTQFSRQTDGLFNPAVGAMIHLWGFDGDELPSGPPPSPQQVAELVAKKPRMEDLTLSGLTLQSSNAVVQLDFGGLAQGVGVDRVIERFKQMGVQNAIINCSGDIHAIGSKGGKPWRVGIRNPLGSGVIASLDLGAEESIVTAGDYERYYEYQGVRYHHIIDPRTGAPARGTTSATAIHSQGTVADAAATALLVAGPKEWQDVSRKLGIHQAMLVASDGTVYLTPDMAGRLHWENDPKPRIIMSGPL